MKGKIILPELARDTERRQTIEQSAIGFYRQAGELSAMIFNPARGPFPCCKILPGAEKTFLPAGHRPSRVAFVQKSFAPLDQFSIDLFRDLSAEIAIAPGCQ